MSYTRKLGIGSDGSAAYGINTMSGYIFDLTEAMALSDTNVGDFDRLTAGGLGFPQIGPLAEETNIFFNQATRLTKCRIFHVHTTTCQLSLKYSTDTTDGVNGIWTNDITFDPTLFNYPAWQASHVYAIGDRFSHSGTYYNVDAGYTSGATWNLGSFDTVNTTTFTSVNYTPLIAPNTLVELDFTDVASCKGIKISFSGVEKPYGLIRLFNLFGEHITPTFRFYQIDGTTELTGDTPLAFTGPFSKLSTNVEVKEFKIKNVDSVSHSFNVDVRAVGSLTGNIANFLRVIDKDALAVEPGTITLTNGSGTVVGTGTSFTANDIGKVIYANSGLITIATFTDATHITTAESAVGSFSGAYSMSPVVASQGVTTGSKAAAASANIMLSLLCPANANVTLGQTEYSLNVTAN